MQQDSTSNEDMLGEPTLQTSSWSSFSDYIEPLEEFFMKALQINPIDVDGSHLSESHKHNFAPFFLIESKNSSSQQKGAPSTTAQMIEADGLMPLMPHDDSDQSEAKKGKVGKKAKKRKDDNNNIHKKFITVQNKVLQQLEMLTKIKSDLKAAKMSLQKGSRHTFVTRLIDAQQLFNQDQFHQFLKKYRAKIAKQFKLPSKPTEAQKLLHVLVKHYTRSCELFAEGRQLEAGAILYDIPGAKEEKYKERGIQKIKEYRKRRFA